MTRLCIALLIGLLAVSPSLEGAEPVNYLRDIKPMLAEKCFACHGALGQESGLRLDTAKLIKEGGDSGAAILPGKAEESLLLERVTEPDDDYRMPPEGEGERLLPRQVALLKAWINAGAPAPEKEQPAQDPRAHWAFQPPVRPALPAVKDKSWVRNRVDTFVAAEHQRRGLRPVPAAEKNILLRRLYYDLIGLPPTSEQLEAFQNDSSPDAYEKVVDRLLASPRYGERWGRHWMDVWRYSDWSGELDNQVRGSPRYSWRWRDWIVQSINEDKPYDRMIHEMLAGDELAPDDPDTLRATGFLARNFYRFNRTVWLDDTIEHTSKAFLGLTISCAKCHNHKFDPITQEEYYRLRAVFEPHYVRTDPVDGQQNTKTDGLPRVYDRDLETPTYLFLRGEESQPVTDQPLTAGVPEVLGGAMKTEPIDLPLSAFYPSLQKVIKDEQALGAQSQKKIAAARRQLAAAKQQVDEARKDHEAQTDPKQERQALEKLQATQAALLLAEKRLAAERAHLPALLARITAEAARYGFASGTDVDRLAQDAAQLDCLDRIAAAEAKVADYTQQVSDYSRKADRGVSGARGAHSRAKKKLSAARQQLQQARQELSAGPSEYRPLGDVYPATSTGRRLAFARWITDRRNPLTARVAANHIWLRHFGAPLVENVFDFGLRAKPPRFGGLLDYLAVELMEGDWKMKRIHRLLVTSSAYRMSSSTRHAAQKNMGIDQDNRLLWRANARRLESEAIRDGILHLAGRLDVTMGGPEIPLDEGQTSLRRSLYFRHAHERQVEFLELFDGANVLECYRRSTSVVPQQALALSNAALTFENARLLARRLRKETAQAAKAEESFITAAFRELLCRVPSGPELARCRAFLRDQTALLGKGEKLDPLGKATEERVPPADDPYHRAQENLLHVLLNHNDFVTIR